MQSESESVREAFAFPGQEASIAQNSGRSLGRRPRQQAIKDRLYFKLKVIKHVGQLVANLKSSIALFSHNLNDRQLSYLQRQENQQQQSNLLSSQNAVKVLLDCILWIVLWLVLWKCSFQMVFTPLAQASSICVSILVVYGLYFLVYLNSRPRGQSEGFKANRYSLFMSYLKFRLVKQIPCFITIIIELIIQPLPGTLLFYITRIIPFFLVTEISIVSKDLEDFFSSGDKGEVLVLFGKLLGKIMIFLHVVSLFLNATRNLELKLGYEVTWAQKYQANQEFREYQLYIIAWYWSSTILCTVGFGDIVPANNIEKVLVSFLEVFSALIFGYFVNYIGSLIKMQSEKTELFESNLRRLNRYLSQSKLPSELRRSARQHFVNAQEIARTYNQSEQQKILGSLSANLKEDIRQYSNLKTINQTPFSFLLNSQLLRTIAHQMRKRVYSPQETVYSPQRKPDTLWIIEKGKVNDIWSTVSGRQSKIVTNYSSKIHENILGWINFLKQQRYRLTAKCEQFSILHEIDRNEFFQTIKLHRPDFLNIMQERDSLINRRPFVPRCSVCCRLNHNTVDCPKIHLPKRNVIFLLAKTSSSIVKVVSGRRKKARSCKKFSWKSCYQFQEQRRSANDTNQLKTTEFNGFLPPRMSTSLKEVDDLIKKKSFSYALPSAQMICQQGSDKYLLASGRKLSTYHDINSQHISSKAIAQSQTTIQRSYDRILWDQQYFSQNHVKVVLASMIKLSLNNRMQL